MKKLLKFYDYLFYCVYHMLNKFKNNGEREDDVVWVFSGFLTFLGCIIVLELFGVLIFTNTIQWRPPIPFLMGLLLVLVAATMYLNRRYFLTNNRFQVILEEYGLEPKRRDIFVGVIAFVIGTCIIFIWASVKIIIWDSLHK